MLPMQCGAATLVADRITGQLGSIEAADVDLTEDKRDGLDGAQGRTAWSCACLLIYLLAGPLTITAMAVAGLFFGPDAVQAQVSNKR